MKPFSLCLLFALAGCSSATTTSPSPALPVATVSAAHGDPAPGVDGPIDEVPAMSCDARDVNVLEHFIKPTCGGSTQADIAACVASHQIPTVFQIKLMPYKVYIVDQGAAPFYKVTDFPAPWCFGGAF